MNNPPAFPGFNNINGYGASKPVTNAAGDTIWENYDTGMTLRDWFAGIALGGLIASRVELPESCQNSRCFEIAARASYKFADAMLAEREKQSPTVSKSTLP